MDEEQKQQLLDKYASNNMSELKKISYPLFIKFGGISEKDHDDFYSKANEELWKATESFDESKGIPFEVYLKSCLARKFKTEMTALNREKRKADRLSTSLDTPIGEDEGSTLGDLLASDFDLDNELLDETGYSDDERVEKYLKSLPNKTRKLIEMKMEGYSLSEIKEKLELSNGECERYMKEAKYSEDISIFRNHDTYKEDDKMCESMPMDTTDSYRVDKNSLYTLLADKRDGKINCKHILQRKPFQWTIKQVNKYLSRILNNQPIPEIVICEQKVKMKKKAHLIDGLQRLSYAEAYRNGAFAIGAEGAEFTKIQYKDYELDKHGNPALDDDGDAKFEIKVFDIVGKKYEDLPEFLKDRFKKFNINVTTFFDCTDEQVAYHIRNYNNHEGMTSNQYEITNINTEIARYIKDISENHSFFKDDIGKYTEKNKIKGITDRVVAESIMTINFLDDWKKKVEDTFQFVNENATEEVFNDFKESLDRLCIIVDKEVRDLFNPTNSPVWFALFGRFKKFGLDDEKFYDFMKEFKSSLHSEVVNGESFDIVYKNRSTKDKTVVMAKINGLEEIMKKYLGVDSNKEFEGNLGNSRSRESELAPYEIVEDARPDNLLNFVRENVVGTILKDDIEEYEDVLFDLTAFVDNSSKLMDKQNHNSLVALVAYSFEKDVDLDDWIVEFFRKNNTYIVNQKENYLHMKDDLDGFTQLLKKRAV